MSLQTDRIFIHALTESSDIAAFVEKRIFTTAIPRAYYPKLELFEEPKDNCPLPYLIITFDGLQNDGQTKDDTYDGGWDNVQVSVEIAAESREDVAAIADTVRRTMNGFVRNYEKPSDGEDLTPLIPSGWDFSATSVAYDVYKPCYWQDLVYQCDTQP